LCSVTGWLHRWFEKPGPASRSASSKLGLAGARGSRNSAERTSRLDHCSRYEYVLTVSVIVPPLPSGTFLRLSCACSFQRYTSATRSSQMAAAWTSKASSRSMPSPRPRSSPLRCTTPPVPAAWCLSASSSPYWAATAEPSFVHSSAVAPARRKSPTTEPSMMPDMDGFRSR